jgi:hypothetical protein
MKLIWRQTKAWGTCDDANHRHECTLFNLPRSIYLFHAAIYSLLYMRIYRNASMSEQEPNFNLSQNNLEPRHLVELLICITGTTSGIILPTNKMGVHLSVHLIKSPCMRCDQECLSLMMTNEGNLLD